MWSSGQVCKKTCFYQGIQADQMVTTTFFLVVMWSGKTLINEGTGDSSVLGRCAFRTLRVLNAG